MPPLPLKQILCGDSAQVLKSLPDNSIDLTVTSPPYDNLRTYNGFTFDFETIVKELFRVTKQGGVLVWIAGNQVVDGDETDTVEKQIIKFKEIGWRKHDTMIYQKDSLFPYPNRYRQVWEFMIIFSKGKPLTTNLLKDKRNKWAGSSAGNYPRNPDGTQERRERFTIQPFGVRDNIWYYSLGAEHTKTEKFAFKHPAVMPEALAIDHIKSWSNEGDIVLDPFAGSGTTLKAAEKLNRQWIGIEISEEYIEIANKRIAPWLAQMRLV